MQRGRRGLLDPVDAPGGAARPDDRRGRRGHLRRRAGNRGGGRLRAADVRGRAPVDLRAADGGGEARDVRLGGRSGARQALAEGRDQLAGRGRLRSEPRRRARSPGSRDREQLPLPHERAERRAMPACVRTARRPRRVPLRLRGRSRHPDEGRARPRPGAGARPHGRDPRRRPAGARRLAVAVVGSRAARPLEARLAGPVRRRVPRDETGLRQTPTHRSRPPLAYYSVANAAHYPGLVALINSLTLVCEPAPIFVTDCGLTERQRHALEPHVTFVSAEPGLHPTLQKAMGPLTHPADVMTVIDADIIVTNPMSDLLARAATGHLVAFEDYKEPDRFFAEWGALDMGAPVRRPYVNAGLLILNPETAEHLFPLIVQLHDRIVIGETMFGRFGTPASPFFYADQDLLNAVLCTCFEGPITRAPRRLAPMPPFTGLTVKDAAGLVCEFDEDRLRPYQLHHTWLKPWLAPLSPTAYSVLFTRLVTGPDVLIRMSEDDIPLRLRDGLGASERAWVSVERSIHSSLRGVHSRVRGRLGLRPKLSRLTRRATASLRG